jgi:hypothetical protein
MSLTLTAPTAALGKVTSFNGLPTAGTGVPAILAAGRQTAQTGAIASLVTFTPAAPGSFLISANVDLTTATSGSFAVTCSYTDDSGTGRSQTMIFLLPGGTTSIGPGSISGAGTYCGMPLHIRANAAAITISTSGTFTTLTYNAEAYIMQIG